MSAPTPINRNAAVIGPEYLGVAPPAAGAAIAAAAADHVHRVFASSSEIFGFGRMAQMSFQNGDGPYPALWALFSQKIQDVPPEWTVEGWLTIPGGAVDLFLMGWSEADGQFPYYQVDQNFAHFMGADQDNALWGGGVAGGGGPFLPGVDATHMFVQMDSSGTMWLGVNGSLRGPLSPPAGSQVYTSGFPMILFQGNGGVVSQTFDVDEVRVSNVLRYPTSGNAYTVPAAPFDPDSSTLLLWHLDDVPYGPFMSSGGDGVGVWVIGRTTADSSVNGVAGVFAICDATGQSTGALDSTWTGVNSNVTPDSGSGAAANVESIQGQTGNFLLVDSGGNHLPVSSPSGAQQIQVVGHLMGSPEYWY